jgi:hypothetical protein
MKRIKLGFKKPEKTVELDKESILVATHKGDINYLRYVKFKQWAPQFWEKMDSPLFAVYFEKFMDLANQGKHTQAAMVMHDYKMALDNSKNSYDAWGICFALISYEKDEAIDSVPNDVELKEKLERYTKKGLTPEMIYESVVNFMKASPETFQDHLILLGAQSMMIETD